MRLLSKLRKQSELIFDIENIDLQELIDMNQKFINEHTYSITKSKQENLSMSSQAFKQSISAYNSLEMGDFLSFSKLYVLKKLITQSNTSQMEEEVKKVEIQHYVEQLGKFNISLVAISANKPTIEQKKNIFRLIEVIKKNSELKERIFRTHKIPLNELNNYALDISTLKKYEKYTMAIMLIHMYQYESLREFVS